MLLLLVQFPFTLLAITLGGVTLNQVLAAYCSLTAYMVLLANVGLLCSVVFRRGGLASSVTGLLILLYLAIGRRDPFPRPGSDNGRRGRTRRGHGRNSRRSGKMVGRCVHRLSRRGDHDDWIRRHTSRIPGRVLAGRLAIVLLPGVGGFQPLHPR